MNRENDATIRQIEFELAKAEHGMALPYDAEGVGQLRRMLVEARKRKYRRSWRSGESITIARRWPPVRRKAEEEMGDNDK
jgi:hypothetical protein